MDPLGDWLAWGDGQRRRLGGICVTLAIVGLWSAGQVPVEWVPSLSLPSVQVAANWPGASPLDIERRVTAPIERALRSVAGGGELQSVSRAGSASLILDLHDRSRLEVTVAEISDRLAALRRRLPEGVVPVLERRMPAELADEQGFMTLELVGDVDPTELRRWADERLAPGLRTLAGVSEVTVIGGQREELQITLSSGRLAALDLESASLRETLGLALESTSLGSLEDGDERRAVVVAAVDTVDDLAEWPLATAGESVDGGRARRLVRLGDVAHLRRTQMASLQQSRIDGFPAVSLYLERHTGSHLPAVASRVRDHLADLSRELPEGTRLDVVEDRGEDVRRELLRLAYRGGAGLCLVLGILFLMLPTPRHALTVLSAVAFTFLLTLGLAWPLGITFNILSLAGLALLAGLLVDNAVVVAERLGRSGRSASPRSAAAAVGELVLPLIGGTVTTVAVLLPLVYSSGELRGLFIPLGVLVVLSLTLSLGVALGLIPLLGPWLGAGYRRGQRRRSWRPLEALVSAVGRWPKLALVALLALLGLPLAWIPERIERPVGGFESAAEEEAARRYNATLGSEAFNRVRPNIEGLLGGVVTPFLRRVEFGQSWSFAERPRLDVLLTIPHTAASSQLDTLIRRFETPALESSSARRTLTRISGEQASLRVLLDDDVFSNPTEALTLRKALIRQALGLAGLEVSVTGLVADGFYSGIGQASGYTIEATGPSFDALHRLAETLADRLRRDRRVAAVDIDAGRSTRWPPREVLGLAWKFETVDRMGLDLRRLDASLSPWLHTMAPDFEADLEGRRSAIRTRIDRGDERQLDDLLATPQSLDTRSFRFEQLGRVRADTQPRAIERSDQQYRRWIRVYYQGPPKMARDHIEGCIRQMALPLGYGLEEQSSIFFSSGVQEELLWLLLAAVVGVFLVLTVVFESWRLPWMVLAGIPLGAMGVAVGFLATGAPFAEGAFLGLILLVGLVVNNGILLVDRFRRLSLRRPRGHHPTLIRLAVRHRLQPMWTTTLTSVVGMLPMLLLPERGDFWLGLAVTVVGGLLVSTFLLPILMVGLVGLRSSG